MGYGNYPTGLSSLEYASKIAFKLLYPAEKYLSNAKYPRCGGYSGGLGTVAKIGDWGLLGEETFIYIPIQSLLTLSLSLVIF
jgi:hypothetical protein